MPDGPLTVNYTQSASAKGQRRRLVWSGLRVMKARDAEEARARYFDLWLLLRSFLHVLSSTILSFFSESSGQPSRMAIAAS